MGVPKSQKVIDMALRDYRTIQDINIGQLGPCLLPGHPKEHVLKLECMSEIRRFLLDDINRQVTDLAKEINKRK